MPKFYLQVQTDGMITDAIEYAHGDYVEIELDSLPVGVHGGWFKLEDGEIVQYPELKTKDESEEIASLKAQLNNAEQEIADLWYQVLVVGGN